MSTPFRASYELLLLDRLGDRDGEWARAFGFARAILATKGRRCHTCGGRLWSGAGRIYCDDKCQRRQGRRRERFRDALREAGEPCPYCNHQP